MSTKDFYDVRYMLADEIQIIELWRVHAVVGTPLPGLDDQVVINGVMYDVLSRTFDLQGVSVAVTIKVSLSSRKPAWS